MSITLRNILIATTVLVTIAGVTFFQVQQPPVTETTLSLVSGNKQYAIGETIPVSVVLNLADIVTPSGADIKIEYDNSILELGDVVHESVFTLTLPIRPVVNGTSTIFGFSPILMPDEEPVTGLKKLSTVNFTPIANGTTTIKFVFTPNASDDTNVAYQGVDALNSVRDLTLVITDSPIKRSK
jgi:hypothetical protein